MLTGQKVRLSQHQRATHAYVIGQPGMGKSQQLRSMIMQDIVAQRGVMAIDVHGDLYDDLVLDIAHLLARDPELARRVILFDPLNPDWTIRFNPLGAISGIPDERMAGQLTDAIITIWNLDTASAPRMMRLLTFSFLALSEFHLTLLDLPRLLRDQSFREELMNKTVHPDLEDYFRFEFPQGEGAIHQWVTPVLNKIGPLVFDPDMRLILGGRSTFHFRQVLSEKLVFLANLPKGILGEGNSSLLAAFLVAHIQQAALSRADTEKRIPFFLYLDEFQNYTTKNVRDILSESRKYGLSLTLAHQFLEQLPTDTRAAVLNTAGTIICFRVGYHDATELAREVFLKNSLSREKTQLVNSHFGGMSLVLPQTKREPLSHEAMSSLLTRLRPREFWMKRRGPDDPTKQRSLEAPSLTPSKELYAARAYLVKVSGSRFGIAKSRAKEQLKQGRENEKRSKRTTTYYENIETSTLPSNQAPADHGSD